jgi:hypothetical protein
MLIPGLAASLTKFKSLLQQYSYEQFNALVELGVIEKTAEEPAE